MAAFHYQALRHSSFKRQDFSKMIAYCTILINNNYSLWLNYFPSLHRSSRSAREIIPFDKWELLPEQIEHEEELGRGAFGVVYKATLKRRAGIEVFDTKKTLNPVEPCQVVAVKKLQGNCNHYAKS